MGREESDWNSVVSAAPGGSFLQSWAWGKLQQEEGAQVWRLEDEQGVALVTQRALPMGRTWLYVPRGPIWESTKYQPLSTKQVPTPKYQTSKPSALGGTPPEGGGKLLGDIVELGREQKAVFIRIEPAFAQPSLKLWLTSKASTFAKATVDKQGVWRPAGHQTQPRHTLVLDLTQSEEDLLAQMHQKTRYNIRLSQRKGVQVRFSRDEADMEAFLALAGDVQERSAFRYHSTEHYRVMLAVLGAADQVELAVAEYKGEVLAVHWLVTFGGVTTYLHGASSSKQRSLMAPTLLQWASIERARERGSHRYDFWGVAPPEAGPDHAWAGITRFKLGFGGERVEYPGTFDYVLDRPWYWLYNLARRVRS